MCICKQFGYSTHEQKSIINHESQSETNCSQLYTNMGYQAVPKELLTTLAQSRP